MKKRLELRLDLNRAAMLVGLWLTCFGLLGLLSDLRQAARPEAQLPAWVLAAAVPPASPPMTAVDLTASSTDGPGMLPALLPSEVDQPAAIDQPAAAVNRAAVVLLPPDRLVIPALGLDAPVVPAQPEQVVLNGVIYRQWQAPDKFAAGWHTYSARPGESGNLVLNGHHNIAGEVFAGLIDLEQGDAVLVHAGDQAFIYRVVRKMILPEQGQSLEVRLDNARWVAPGGPQRLTLITCWPAESNTHRLVVIAVPVPE